MARCEFRGKGALGHDGSTDCSKEALSEVDFCYGCASHVCDNHCVNLDGPDGDHRPEDHLTWPGSDGDES